MDKLEIAFEYLIGDRQFPIPESEDGAFSQEAEGMGKKPVDTLKEAISRLEKTMFCRKNVVKEDCEPQIWGKDVGPHQEGMEIVEFAHFIGATDEDYNPIEDDDYLEEMFEVCTDFYL